MGAGTGAGIVTGTPAEAIGIRTWVGAWSTSQAVPGPANPAPFAGFNNQSVRMLIRTSISGEQIRIRLANTFGDRHLTVGHATVGLSDTTTPTRLDVQAATVKDITFGGSQSAFIPRFSEALSDPVPLSVPALQELVVTLYLPAPTGPPTFHSVASNQIFVGPGDLTTDAPGAGFVGIRTNYYFLSGVDVLTRKALGTVVILGDSIVDGAFSTFNGYGRWSDRLAERLQAEDPLGPFELGVLNQGIGGNALTHDGSETGPPPGSPGVGINGLARLDTDVFGQPGVRIVAICLGVNDIQLFNDSPDRIIAALKQASVQLKAANMIAIACQINPFEGYVNWTPEKEVTRQAVNDYLRTTNDFHGVLDFNPVLRDPANPNRLRPDLDSGDHIHPNPAGYAAMGDSIPLRLFG